MLAKARYRAASIQAFRDVISAWIATLPPDGWEGTIRELKDALEAAHALQAHRGWIPRGTGLGVQMRGEVSFLEANGFALSFSRTAMARTIRVERASRDE